MGHGVTGLAQLQVFLLLRWRGRLKDPARNSIMYAALYETGEQWDQERPSVMSAVGVIILSLEVLRTAITSFRQLKEHLVVTECNIFNFRRSSVSLLPEAVVLVAYLCAIESHAGEHGLGHAGSLQLIPDLLIDLR